MNSLKSIFEGSVLGMATSKVYFEDNKLKVIDLTENIIEATLLECAAELTSATARNQTRVKTGKTKNSWKAHVHKTSDGYEAVIGSPEENAIWEEFGTGEYALNGDGRKGGWEYEDPKTGETIWTYGKKPLRAFWKAYNAQKSKIVNQIQNSLKGL